MLEDDDVKKRFRSVDDRLEATSTQISNLQETLSAQLDKARRDLARQVIWGVLLSTFLVGLMCLLTLVILL